MSLSRFVSAIITPLEILAVYFLTCTSFSQYHSLIVIFKIYLCLMSLPCIILFPIFTLIVFAVSQETLATVKGADKLANISSHFIPASYQILINLVLLVVCGMAGWTVTCIFLLVNLLCYAFIRSELTYISDQIKDYKKKHPDLTTNQVY